MTRVIAGQARGRTLVVPRRGTRPTSDRVRESMFATLDSMLQRTGDGWDGIAVADLFAGSGALGLEAMSRGAASVVLVDSARAAIDALRRNVETVLPDRSADARVVASDVAAWTRAAAPGSLDLVFIDPPYDLGSAAVDALVGALLDRGVLRAGGIVVVERRTGDDNPLADVASRHGLDVSQRRYGDTLLWYGRRDLASQTSAGMTDQPDEHAKGE